MTNNQTIAKNTLFLYTRMLLIMGVSLYTSRVILKTLGVDDYGLYNVVGGIVTMFSFLNGSLGAATSRYITFSLGKKDFEQLNKIFNTAFINHILIAIIIVLLCESLGLWLFYNKMQIPVERLGAAFWVFQISILTSFFSLTQVPYSATIIAYENMSIYAYVGFFEALARLAIVFLIQISPMDKLVFYALLLCVLQIGVILFYRAYCRRHYECTRLKLYKDKALYKEMFVYGGSDLIGNLSVMAQGQGLNILLNIFFGPAVNAARAIAYQVQGAVTQFSGNFMTAVKPQIIKQYAEGDIKDMMKLVYNSSCFSYYLMWMICLPLCLEANYILHLWLGNYPEHTVTFLILTLILCLIQTLKTPRSTIFHATGHLKRVNIIVGSILCAALPLAYVFLKIGWSPESVFWAAIITMALSEAASIIILKRYINYSAIDYTINVHGRCLLVTAISFIVPFFLYRIAQPSFIRLIITCVISTISIGFTCFYIGMNKDMREKMIGMIKAKLNRK